MYIKVVVEEQQRIMTHKELKVLRVFRQSKTRRTARVMGEGYLVIVEVITREQRSIAKHKNPQFESL